MESLADQLRREMLARQRPVSSVDDLFDEEPVPLDVFVGDKAYLGAPPLGPKQADLVQHIERIYLPHTYVQLAESFDAKKQATKFGYKTKWSTRSYWGEDIRMVNHIVAEWGKGCILPDEQIYNAQTGQWRAIAEVPDGVTAALDGQGQVEVRKHSSGFARGVGQCYRVVTGTGAVLKVFGGHQFLSKAGWRPLSQLGVGARIALATRLPCLSPTRLPSREVELVGGWIGDGIMPSGKGGLSMIFGEGEPQALHRYLQLVREMGVEPALTQREGKKCWYVGSRQGRDGRGQPNPLMAVARKYGLRGKTAASAHIPDQIFSCPDDQLELFLSRLWGTDGHVHVPARLDQPAEAGYVSISEELVRGVGRLLLRLGISSEVRSRKVRGFGLITTAWEVRLRRDADLRRFCERIILLDKREAQLRVLVHLEAKKVKRQASRYHREELSNGDVRWTTIKSMEPLGECEYWDLTVERDHNYVTDGGVLNHNSGKDSSVRIATARIAYLLLCLKDPLGYFGFPEYESIHLLNVAPTAQLASRVFFTPLTRMMTRGWFADRAKPLNSVVEFDKNIVAISGNSDADTQEGLNLILGVADEVDAFSEPSVLSRGTRSAGAIMKMIASSGASRFPLTFKSVVISFPRYKGSTIQLVTDKAKRSVERDGAASAYYASGPHATWDVNPLYDQYERIEVSGSPVPVPNFPEFIEQFDEINGDPVDACTKYLCDPPESENAVFRNIEMLDRALPEVPHQPLEVEYELVDGHWQAHYRFHPDLLPYRGALYALHGDLAITADRAGIAMAHVERYETRPETTWNDQGEEVVITHRRPVVKVDFVISYEAALGLTPPRQIQIRWARELFFELRRRGFRVMRYTFDGFECLSGDTQIPLLDGTTHTMRELVDREPFWLYSIKDGVVVPGLCTKAWSTGWREDMLEVELDNGQVIRATGDHRFMLRDGTYRRADQLKPQDSLMPLYRRLRPTSSTSSDYEQVWHPEKPAGRSSWEFTHRAVARHLGGPIPRRGVIHHKNHVPTNNDPSNLQRMTGSEHVSLHVREDGSCFSRLWNDPEWRELHKARIGAATSARQIGQRGEEANRYRHDITMDDVRGVYEQCLIEGVKPSRLVMQSRLGCTQDLLYARVRDAGYASWKDFRNAHESISPQARYMRRIRGQAKTNHKVVAVRPAPPEEVFDLQVEEHHNFATEAGVFVHNSRDSRQLLELHGVETDRVSTDRDPGLWRNLQVLIDDERLKGYRRMPLYRELRRLTRLKNGKVDHPMPAGPNNSKDEADALAGAVFGAVEVGGAESGEALKGMAPDKFEAAGRFGDTRGRQGLRGGFSPDQLRIGFQD